MKSPKSQPESPTMITRAEPIEVGIPTNSRLFKDLNPLIDSLELEEGPNGMFFTWKIPGALFSLRRVRDIAMAMRYGMTGLGVLTEDIAIDELIDRDNKIDPNLFIKQNRCFPLKQLPSTKLCLLQRDKDVAYSSEIGTEREFGGALITAYPRATRAFWDMPNEIVTNEGQNEFFLRNLPKRFGAAVEVVRTGATAKQYGLTCVRDFITSQPGLWKSANPKLPINQLADVEARIREQVGKFL